MEKLHYSYEPHCSPYLQGLPRLSPACQAHSRACGRPMPLGNYPACAPRAVSTRNRGQSGHHGELTNDW
jgi:hypothetical protein